MNKILVIDDEPWLREMVRLALEQRGFEVLEAADSVEGVAKARNILPDLIICDVNMDKAGAGYTTLSKLREDAATSTIPFILMTGLSDASGMRHAMELGADDYLPKPFKVDELCATVDTRLRKVRMVRDHAEQKLSLLRSHISLMLPHEMLTPLNGIISNAEMLATDPGSLDLATIAEMGQEICKSSERLERLIENFLFHARLEIVATDAESVKALRAARTLRTVDLLQETAGDQAGRAHRLSDLTVKAAEVTPAMAEEYFKKTVAELVQNAFKFSKSGTPVHVSLAADGDEIEFSVRDAGRGFSPEQVQRIGAYVQFERKMQDEQGLGLGLAIAKKLVELHGGSLGITGEIIGSTVTVRLPAAKKA